MIRPVSYPRERRLPRAVRFGLARSLFTRNVALAHEVSGNLEAGAIGINTHHVVNPAMPFGGFKQ